MATFDGSDEPLFADDLDNYSDDEPPPLPPPVVPRSRTTPSSSVARNELNPSQQVDGVGRSWSPSRISQGRRQIRRIQTEDEDGLPTDGNKDSGTPLKKVRKPLLTFKMDRLFSENGFPYLVKEFPKLKFKGKGEEVKDLKLLLHQYEEWANIVYPKLTFPDFCKQVESMSKKSEFRSQLNVIRRQSVAGLDGCHSDDGSEVGLSNVITERLSPELEDTEESDLTNQNIDDSHDTENNDITNQQSVPTGTIVEEVHSQWDVAMVTEEEEEDPYEDFPDL